MKSVLVTGASKGIGEACVARLAGEGFRVFAGVRRQEDGERLRAQSGEAVRPVLLDVTDSAQIEAAARLLETELGEAGLEGVVNNAGVAIAGPLEYLPIDELRRQLEINVVGQVAVTQAVLPRIRKAQGRVVFIGSVAGRSALPFTGAYAALKHALEAIADALRVELLPWGIHVSIVEPGVIATPIWETSLAHGDTLIGAMPAEARSRYGPLIDGLRRVALRGARGEGGLPPDAVAMAVTHALTASRPRPRYVVGTDARIRLAIGALLPTRLRDRLIVSRLRKLASD